MFIAILLVVIISSQAFLASPHGQVLVGQPFDIVKVVGGNFSFSIKRGVHNVLATPMIAYANSGAGYIQWDVALCRGYSKE